ncbi:MAG: helix-turn-helix transcriptional regulator [Gemmatimonadota bacterium]|nr:helix-turn-helix transcriptional regulator [Gemmatimonadota bacterium]MDE2865293.1 helix-turn-helix transcriptional regulator [Gemmatimonadota bacterium]
MQAAHDPRYLEFAARLRRARTDKGLTQAQLAALLGKPQPYVSKIETCERRIDIVETADWCIRLDVGIADVLPRSLVGALRSRPESGQEGVT